MLKEIAQYFFKLCGYEIIPVWRKKNLYISKSLILFFDKHNIDCVIDVGANNGQYYSFLRDDVGFDGWVLSFEPLKENFLRLKEMSAADSKWKVFNYALGNKNTEIDINVMKASEFSSFLTPSDSETNEYNSINIVERTETVKMRTLESVWSDAFSGINPSNIYLKMDTQGYDLDVVKGLGNAVKNIRGLQTEVAVIKIYDQMPSMHEVINVLDELGFNIYGMFPVTIDSKDRVVEFDMIMVNNGI